MKVNSVNKSGYYSNFTGLKYQNGIKTKNALSSDIKEFLSANKDRINALRDIDIIVDSDKKDFMLGIKNIRYLNPHYKRFYDNGEYDIQLADNGEIEIWNRKKADLHYRRWLKPTVIPGIYNVSIAQVLGFLDLRPEYYSYNSPAHILECAELLDSASKQIDAAEKEFGMDCVEALDNVDEYMELGHRMNIIDKIINTYTFEQNIQERMPTRELEALYSHKETVDEFKSYGIHLDTSATPEVVDKKGYVNENYSEFYEQNGYVIYYSKDRNDYTVAPIDNEYVYYTLCPSKDNDGKYTCHKGFYDGGSNLSCFYGDHFDQLVDFLKILEKIAQSIEGDQS